MESHEQLENVPTHCSMKSYEAVLNELERAKELNASQGREIEALKVQLSETKAAGMTESNALVEKLRYELENKEKLLVEMRSAGCSYRDRFKEKSKEVDKLNAELEELRCKWRKQESSGSRTTSLQHLEELEKKWLRVQQIVLEDFDT